MKVKSNIVILGLLLLASCGGGSAGGGAAGSAKKPARPEVRNPIHIDIDASIDGQYLAVFETVNPEITSKITGAFTFSRDKIEDEMVGDVRLNNGGAKLIHPQNVRLGNRCPTKEDDLNQDGVIDGVEGEAVYGKVLFPLDGDLSSQSSHDGEFPVGDVYGNYIWSRVTQFSTFINDLRSEEDDLYVKLKADEPLAIEGRVVVVHGIDEAVELPATAAYMERLTPHQTLPIACGVIQKVLTPPGEIDDGTYPAEMDIIE